MRAILEQDVLALASIASRAQTVPPEKLHATSFWDAKYRAATYRATCCCNNDKTVQLDPLLRQDRRIDMI
jgi:hypothetical protein